MKLGNLHIQYAAADARVYGFDHVGRYFALHMGSEDRQEFDLQLVEAKHPLAYEPGTTEQRFRQVVREYMDDNPEPPPLLTQEQP